MTLRWRLVLLVAGAVLPVALFAIIVATLLVQYEQRQFISAVQARNRAFMTAVDTELEGHTATLLAVSTSASLAVDDLVAFRRDAQAALQTQSDWENIVLNAPDGRQLVNAVRSLDSLVARAPDAETVRRVADTGRPLVVDLRRREISGRYAIPIRVPIIRDGRVVYVLTALVRPEVFESLIKQQDLPQGWVSGLADGEKRFIARVPPRPVHSPVSPDFARAVDRSAEGWYRGETAEGLDTFTAFARSRLTNWTIGVAIPADVVLASSRRAAWLMTGFGLLSLLIASGLAFYVGRRISRPITALAGAVDHLNAGTSIKVSSDIREIAELARALQHASEAMLERQRLEREQHRLETERRKLLEQNDRAKDEFLAMLSHELRNPLAGIVTASQLLSVSQPGGDVALKAREIIDRQARHMRQLVDDLIDVSRVTMGKIQLDREVFDLTAAVRQAVELLMQSDRGRKYRFNLRADTPALIYADRARIDQVLANVLDNALKFSDEGGTIDVDVDVDAARVAVTIADHGRGIEPDQLKEIFGLFVQGHQELDRSRGGLGIGLAVVRRLVELHGGTITAYSGGPGAGSAFVVCLPKAAPAATHAGADADNPIHGCKRVLVVEDNDDAGSH